MAFSKLCERNIKHNKFNSKVDLIILGTLKEQIFQAFTKLALNCVSKSAEDRPTMVHMAKPLTKFYHSSSSHPSYSHY